MTAQTFRKLALSLNGAIERAHMDHPDFRIEGKVFASLGAPDKTWGMVKLTPAQQQEFTSAEPAMFRPCAGAWGQRGYTNVLLDSAKKAPLLAALDAASKNVFSSPNEQKLPPR